ncbi:MAG: bifunctional pyr operon transcriptional regulator/uracil phosphoribosyltransferase PyrR [Deltaproteobacteria bacterium]|jgi:pyrimidine operon attenuation protein/uracil phosphoribosyltransferase|nr:bifunctional pyr operon transcriptional regulator/uracil phosphoribosyltransferase PyrR [Deltaproteobacteria bacterium]
MLTQLKTGPDIDKALIKMADGIYKKNKDEKPILIGIRSGGVPMATRLAKLLAERERYGSMPKLGIVDINLYRDDWNIVRCFPKVGPTNIPYSLDNSRVVLVDDVLYTGRTVKAALGVLNDFGRPAKVELAIMADRGDRQMPIQPDYCGIRIDGVISGKVIVDFTEGDNSKGITVVGQSPGQQGFKVTDQEPLGGGIFVDALNPAT